MNELVFFAFLIKYCKYIGVLLFFCCCYYTHRGLPRWRSSKESAHHRKRHEFDFGVRKDPLEWEMATHSSVLACRIPRTQELGGLPCTSPEHHSA